MQIRNSNASAAESQLAAAIDLLNTMPVPSAAEFREYQKGYRECEQALKAAKDLDQLVCAKWYASSKASCYSIFK